MEPKVIVIGGANGSGKSTMASYLVPSGCPFLNADEIANDLAHGQDLLAGKRFFAEWDRLHLQRQSFAVESTLAGKALARRITKLKADGYGMELYYIWTPLVELNVARVLERTRVGGHNVPEVTIRRRYLLGAKNLFGHYMPLADAWTVFENATLGAPTVIAMRTEGGTQHVLNADAWRRMLELRENG